MDGLSSIVGAVAPSWVLVALIGALWAGLVSVLVPPRLMRFPWILLAAVVGAVAGQVVSASLGRPLPAIGDVRLVGTSVGALMALGVVWRFWS